MGRSAAETLNGAASGRYQHATPINGSGEHVYECFHIQNLDACDTEIGLPRQTEAATARLPNNP